MRLLPKKKVIVKIINRSVYEVKMFRNILLIYSEKITEKHLDMIRTVMSDIEKLKIMVNAINVKYLERKYFENIDLAVTIGGDGTFIRTSHLLKFYTPILGINSDPEHSEGALLVRYEDFKKILSDWNSLYGKAKLNKIDRIQTIRNGTLLEEFAINEVYIGTEKQFTTARYVIDYRGNREEHRSSGVLVVTPSGSRSWYKSAGGKPFGNGGGNEDDDKKLKFIVREPYFGKIYNPKILNCEILLDEKIVFYSRRYDDGIIAIDSYKVYPFNIGDTVEINMSDIPLRVVSS